MEGQDDVYPNLGGGLRFNLGEGWGLIQAKGHGWVTWLHGGLDQVCAC